MRVRILAILLGLTACGKPAGSTSTENFLPTIAGTVSPARFKSVQEAGLALMPGHTRTIPLSTFHGSTEGLKLGARLGGQRPGGRQLIGTVVAIDAESVTIAVESW